MTIDGQDWAGYQAATPPTAGLEFVIIKVTEGTSFTNSKWQQQRDHAHSAGLAVGYYHFARGVKNIAEADYFLKQTGTLQPGEFLVFDWEDSDVSNAEKDAWLQYVQGKVPQHRVGLYANRDFWLHRDGTSVCGDFLWIADPSAPAGQPRVQHPWVFHQFSSAGGVDRNVGNFASLGALRTWALKGVKPPQLPAVDLSELVRAAKADPRATQGHRTYAAGVRLVESALRAEHLLDAKYAADGSFGSLTVKAYQRWQLKLYPGASTKPGGNADGIPGMKSLSQLGKKHGFRVVT